MKTTRTITIALLTLMMTLPAFAGLEAGELLQQAGELNSCGQTINMLTDCGSSQEVYGDLMNSWGESRRARALSEETNNLIEVFVNPDSGTWSLLITNANNESCFLSAGNNYGEKQYGEVNVLGGQKFSQVGAVQEEFLMVSNDSQEWNLIIQKRNRDTCSNGSGIAYREFGLGELL